MTGIKISNLPNKTISYDGIIPFVSSGQTFQGYIGDLNILTGGNYSNKVLSLTTTKDNITISGFNETIKMKNSNFFNDESNSTFKNTQDSTSLFGLNNTFDGSTNCMSLHSTNTNFINSTNCITLLGNNLTLSNVDNSVSIGMNIINASSPNTVYVENMEVLGHISKSTGTFKIDHPDPEKTEDYYLYHSFVESPTQGDSIYRYKITPNGNEHTIKLPNYFKHLNKDVQVWVSPSGKNFTLCSGEYIEEENVVIVYCENPVDLNVLIIGTRKDEISTKNWMGVEVKKIK